MEFLVYMNYLPAFRLILYLRREFRGYYRVLNFNTKIRYDVAWACNAALEFVFFVVELFLHVHIS